MKTEKDDDKVEEIERELVKSLVQVYLNEPPYSIRRLLAADFKVSFYFFLKSYDRHFQAEVSLSIYV